MNLSFRLVAATLVGVAGAWLAASGWVQRRPSLHRQAATLARVPAAPAAIAADGWSRAGRVLCGRCSLPFSVVADLRLIQRPPEAHAAMLVGAAVAGLFGPTLAIAVGQAFGAVELGIAVPVVAALLGAAVLPAALHSRLRTTARAQRGDLRHQLSAYLDVVTMLLAGNMGNEGALREAAQAGDGRLFVELRRHIVVAETGNRSLVSALAELGDRLQLIELQQIAASAALGASAGAPVARSLAAKCATLRSALASEQEADARVRTGKITVPLVGMSLLVMTAVMFPALNQ